MRSVSGKATAFESRLATPYVPRRPQETVLYGLVKGHWRDFVLHAGEAYEAPLPKYVVEEFQKCLACGDFAEGFVHVQCTWCGDDLAVAFSSKVRGLCPSCAGRRMAGSAARLVDRVLPMAGDDELRFEPAPAPTRAELEALVQRVYVRVMKWLARRGLLRGDADASNALPSVSPNPYFIAATTTSVKVAVGRIVEADSVRGIVVPVGGSRKVDIALSSDGPTGPWRGQGARRCSAPR